MYKKTTLAKKLYARTFGSDKMRKPTKLLQFNFPHEKEEITNVMKELESIGEILCQVQLNFFTDTVDKKIRADERALEKKIDIIFFILHRMHFTDLASQLLSKMIRRRTLVCTEDAILKSVGRDHFSFPSVLECLEKIRDAIDDLGRAKPKPFFDAKAVCRQHWINMMHSIGEYVDFIVDMVATVKKVTSNLRDNLRDANDISFLDSCRRLFFGKVDIHSQNFKKKSIEYADLIKGINEL